MTKAALMRAFHEPLSVEEVTLPHAGPGEVKVRLLASGICHSDLSVQSGVLLSSAQRDGLATKFPMVLGHEGAGVITEVGAGVTSLREGDHVITLPIGQCGDCVYCSKSQPFLCDSGQSIMRHAAMPDGSTRFATESGESVWQMSGIGTLAEELIVTPTSLVKIAPGVNMASASLVGCAILTGSGSALNTADIKQGDTVVVVGCGPVGQSIIQGARIAGAERIIAVDLLPSKLALATKVGATDEVLAGPDRDVVDEVRKLTNGHGVDVAFEAIGLQVTTDQAIKMTAKGGQIIIVGMAPRDVMVSMPSLSGVLRGAKTIRGSYFGWSDAQKDVARLLEYYKEGVFHIDEIISSVVKIDQVNDGFSSLKEGKETCVVVDLS
ncbi:Zn-dependent alcohol dehydrogenase [Rhodococcus olei]|uniref:Zn-dependent alcohol dehydrogenase n=1 Tax=Rhodococcus olei TaxID=2161675 RepID=A0ABP8PSY1_9NOCA